jgi:glutathione-independent formaldehyde dehydrogenase
MRAVVYREPFSVTIDEVERPEIKHPNDVIVRVTSSAICGSDLHMYEGRTAARPGIVFGHENLGIIEELGSGVTSLHKGDRVVMPFNVACGFCKNCIAGNTGFCLTVNPGFAGGAYGYVAMGPYTGGQAEYLRVPYADFNCLVLPSDGREADYVLLADIFPTGYHGCELAQVSPGETVAVFGAGPVGLMAAYSALLRGASRVFVVDRVPERLAKAERIGAIPIDFTQGDPTEQIRSQTHGEGSDKGVDAVGYQAQAHDISGEEPAVVLNSLIDTVRPTGRIGVPGLYVPSDPGGPTEQAQHGMLLVSIGRMFEKGQRIGTGQCNVKRYNRQLRDLITAGRATPSFVVSHELSLGEAPDAYRKFDQRIEGYTKVVLHP